jgi:hypothetical protein
MSESLYVFITFFDKLSPDQQAEIFKCLAYYYSQQNTRNYDGIFAGPLPSQGLNPCPRCGKPL